MIVALAWCTYVIGVAIGTEVFAYLWHRYGAHADYIPGIHDTHRIHHSAKLTHEANEDFVWILLLFIIAELIVGIAVTMKLISGVLGLITLLISLVVFWWNWWIHKAYHQPNHWLNTYQWFRNEQARHYIHHHRPQKNYGIASHFTDRIMGTWLEPIGTYNSSL